MASERQWFETHADVNSVEFATVGGKLIRLENGKPYGTAEPLVIAELEAHQHVKASSDPKKTEPAQPPAQTEAGS